MGTVATVAMWETVALIYLATGFVLTWRTTTSSRRRPARSGALDTLSWVRDLGGCVGLEQEHAARFERNHDPLVQVASDLLWHEREYGYHCVQRFVPMSNCARSPVTASTWTRRGSASRRVLTTPASERSTLRTS